MSYKRWTGAGEGSRIDEESYNAGPDCSIRRSDVVVPVYIHPCPRHPGSPSKEERELSSDQGERIKIAVGSGCRRRTFLVHKRLVCRHSSYFEVALKQGNEKAFVEAATGEFEWREDDPENVSSWIRWLYSCESCKLYDIYDPEHMCPDDNEDPMSWCNVNVHAEEAFVLGDRIGYASYCTFALSSFIQHVHLLHPTTVLWAYENTLPHSSLHRFIAHWIAWIKFKVYQKEPFPFPLGRGTKPPEDHAPENLDRQECSVYAEVFAHCKGWSSIDPRGYFMAHWSEPCSDAADARCCHKRICHYFASYATKFSIIEEPDAIFRLGFQLERGRLQRVREGPRPRSRLVYVDQSLVLLWWAAMTIILILGPAIYIKADSSLLNQHVQINGIIVAILGLLGCYLCRSTSYLDIRARDPSTWKKFAFSMLLVSDMIYSAASAGCATTGCLKIATGDDLTICKLEAIMATMEVLYAVILAGFMLAYWKQWMPITRYPSNYSMDLVYY